MQEFKLDLIKDKKESLYICAGGFEDRVRGIISNFQELGDKVFGHSFILEYTTHKDDNEKNLDFLKKSLAKHSSQYLPNVKINIDNLLSSRNNLGGRLKELQKEKIDTIFIDISGMTNSFILLTLKMTQTLFYDKEIFILYSEARDYYPKRDEVDEILALVEKRDDASIIKLGEKLQTSGARETLIPSDFKGSFREDLPTALIFLVGYEPSRAIGLLETYRPSLVIPCYGVSPHEHFKWRTEFSVKLHKEFRAFEQYPHLKEDRRISTFNISETINELERIYICEIEGKVLYENFNVAISPQCSKLQAVATYLFCQSHPDVQVVFCLPGSFNPKRYTEGIGRSWICKLVG